MRMDRNIEVLRYRGVLVADASNLVRK
jgi:hypothetical protein